MIAPVANAGPDQIGFGGHNHSRRLRFVRSGRRRSHLSVDPGFRSGVSLAGMNTARQFTAAEGQSYGFRLVVKDPQGQQGVDTLRSRRLRPNLSRLFGSRLARIVSAPAKQSTLDWQVLNADTVTITELGSVPGNGSRAVFRQPALRNIA